MAAIPAGPDPTTTELSMIRLFQANCTLRKRRCVEVAVFLELAGAPEFPIRRSGLLGALWSGMASRSPGKPGSIESEFHRFFKCPTKSPTLIPNPDGAHKSAADLVQSGGPRFVHFRGVSPPTLTLPRGEGNDSRALPPRGGGLGGGPSKCNLTIAGRLAHRDLDADRTGGLRRDSRGKLASFVVPDPAMAACKSFLHKKLQQHFGFVSSILFPPCPGITRPAVARHLTPGRFPPDLAGSRARPIPSPVPARFAQYLHPG